MTQSEPVKKPTDVGTVDDDTALAKFHAQLVQRQLAVLFKSLGNPIMMLSKLAVAKVP